jgi:putative Holliday junction resolvase
VDLGARRIGVAVSDRTGVLASPYAVIQRGRDHAEDHRRLAAFVEEIEAGVVVVGYPISLDGSIGPAARLVEAEVEELRADLPVPIELHDERFSTVTAHRALQERGLNEKKRRKIVDQVAAAVFLQSWLDSRPASGAGGTGG